MGGGVVECVRGVHTNTDTKPNYHIPQKFLKNNPYPIYINRTILEEGIKKKRGISSLLLMGGGHPDLETVAGFKKSHFYLIR